ncbi:methyltransferase, partial [Streptomyces sp. 150FB]|uniref:class I SAM-dependent methyltransferase n=1 Tax=Streptomyces sp. 150FB TaxID=1576605 RepID=UPI0005896CCA
LPAGTRTLVDVACGTGIVTRRLRGPGRRVLGADRSPGMLAMASGRLPNAVVTGDATRLPVGSGSVDAVVLIWLLHLLPEAAPVLAEAARVLRPGGVLITTVDKTSAAFRTDGDDGDNSDLAALVAPVLRPYRETATDRFDSVVELGARYGLRPVGETVFWGVGQGRSPRHWREQIRTGRDAWTRRADPAQVARLCDDLAELPDQETARPDPLYRLVALGRTS